MRATTMMTAWAMVALAAASPLDEVRDPAAAAAFAEDGGLAPIRALRRTGEWHRSDWVNGVASALRGGVRKAPRGSHHPSPDEAVAAPPQFPGSRIVTNVTGLVDPKLGKHPPPGSGQTKSLNGWANKPEAQVWALCYSSFTDNSDNATAFHKQCDMHDETMVFVKNELNFTFGGYAAGSWGFSTCCANSTTPPPYGPWPYPARGNQCFKAHGFRPPGCTDRIHEEDFIFRLSGGPQVFRPAGHCWNCGGDINEFQIMGPNQWPHWGSFDLRTGQFGPPGKDGCCLQGFTYAGYENNACGGDNGNGSWGKTDLEVWYPVGEK